MDERPMEKLAEVRTVESLWQEILEKDDRTSPAEYPEMALITFEEFRDALSAPKPLECQSGNAVYAGPSSPTKLRIAREGVQTMPNSAARLYGDAADVIRDLIALVRGQKVGG